MWSSSPDTQFITLVARLDPIISIKPGDEHKTPHGQCVHRRMGKGLKGSMFTYSQFANLFINPIPAGAESEALPSIIRNNGAVGFCPFVCDHNTGADSFNDMFIKGPLTHTEHIHELLKCQLHSMSPLLKRTAMPQRPSNTYQSLGSYDNGIS